MPRKNYLNNSAILREIQKSKMSFCAFTDFDYTKNVLIVNQEEFKKLTKTKLIEALNEYNRKLEFQLKCERISQQEAEKLFAPIEKPIVRVMTEEHLPLELQGKKTGVIKFSPFKHYMWIGGKEKWKEVLRSQWSFSENSTDLDKGYFNQDQGQLTPTLINMMITLAEKYCKRPNLKGYTFVEDMIQESVFHLCSFAILKFNEYKSENPFAYGSQSILNICRQMINKENKQRQLKDEIAFEMDEDVSWEFEDAKAHGKGSAEFYNGKRARSIKSFE